MELTPTEQLDAVLNCFKDKTQLQPQTIQIELKNDGIELEAQYIVEILKKLEKDGFARFVHEEIKSRMGGQSFGYFSAWFITFEGHLLRQTGGYKTKTLMDNAVEKRALWVDDQLVSNTKKLNDLTRGLVIATVFLIFVGIATIVWDAVKFCFEHHCNIQDVLKSI